MTNGEHRARKFDEFDLLTVKEAADLLRCSESTVRRAIASSEINWFRVRPHGGIRIPAFALEQLIRPHLLEAAEAATAAVSDVEL